MFNRLCLTIRSQLFHRLQHAHTQWNTWYALWWKPCPPPPPLGRWGVPTDKVMELMNEPGAVYDHSCSDRVGPTDITLHK